MKSLDYGLACESSLHPVTVTFRRREMGITQCGISIRSLICKNIKHESFLSVVNDTTMYAYV